MLECCSYHTQTGKNVSCSVLVKLSEKILCPVAGTELSDGLIRKFDFERQSKETPIAKLQSSSNVFRLIEEEQLKFSDLQACGSSIKI